jgi:hypothetical protein
MGASSDDHPWCLLYPQEIRQAVQRSEGGQHGQSLEVFLVALFPQLKSVLQRVAQGAQEVRPVSHFVIINDFVIYRFVSMYSHTS